MLLEYPVHATMSAIAHLLPSSVSKLATQNPISTMILIHNDHSNRIKSEDSDSSDGDDSDKSVCVARGGVVTPFPWKVHDVLEKGHIDGIRRYCFLVSTWPSFQWCAMSMNSSIKSW
jgi:hypothetical protein